ncbi:hypothetical protein JVU11DRAFT_3282 [Chiua virens]|nr:hypothetical protein JVU11DRAFT_3282 [Chiua virens]
MPGCLMTPDDNSMVLDPSESLDSMVLDALPSLSDTTSDHVTPSNASTEVVAYNPWNATSGTRPADPNSEPNMQPPGAKVKLVEIDRSTSLRTSMYSLKSRFQRTSRELESTKTSKKHFYQSALVQYNTLQEENAKLKTLEEEYRQRNTILTEESDRMRRAIIDQELVLRNQQLAIEKFEREVEAERQAGQAMHRAEADVQTMIQRMKVSSFLLT